MTLDEAIAHEKIDSEHCSILCTHETNINDCIECRAYHKQVYEWLKELKKIKSSTVPYYDGFKEGKQVGYDKAIDDFVKEISESNKGHWRPTKYEHGEVVSETMSYDIGTIRLITEQLKAGEQNE